MANERELAVGLRLSICETIGTSNAGDSKSLRNINTSKLTSGALAMVVENGMLYQLVKSSTQTADNVVIVQPVAGPGRWVQLAQAPGAAPMAMLYASAASNTVATASSGEFEVVTGSAFQLQPGDPIPGWALTQASGILTYQGLETVPALITLSATLAGVEEASGEVYAGIAINDDIVGSVNTFLGVEGCSIPSTGFGSVTTQRRVILSPNSTIRAAFRADALDSLEIIRLGLSVSI